MTCIHLDDLGFGFQRELPVYIGWNYRQGVMEVRLEPDSGLEGIRHLLEA